VNTTELTAQAPVFAAWIKANNDHDLQGILACYASRVSMFATFEDYIASGTERERYFTTLLTNPDLAVKVDSLILEQEGDVQIIHGDYTFSHRKGGVLNVLPARYTMVIQNSKITHHHSSQMAGTKLIESHYKTQIWETITEQAVSPHLSVKAGFCNFVPEAKSVSAEIDGLIFGRYTSIFKDGVEIHKHVSPEPSSVTVEKIQYLLKASA
jgi:hypothetical protein